MSTDKRANNQATGHLGEQFAADYVQQILGWRLIARNWRCRAGELDIVAEDTLHTVIIEVKARHSERMGMPLEAVDKAKQLKLRRLADWYLADPTNAPLKPIRIDVIGVLIRRNRIHRLEHVRDALMV